MDFSDIISGVTEAYYSPDSNYLAVTNGTKLIIKNAANLENKQVFSFPDAITHFEFSSDSQYILIVMSKRGIVEAKSIQDDDWNCKIEDQLNGILYARFSPDGKFILTFSDYQLKASIYSLVDKSIAYIKSPKYPDKGISFSSDGKFMALAERRDVKDYIGIYFCKDWNLVNHFLVDTIDLADICWSPDNTSVVAWDSILYYKLLVYCPGVGLKAKFQPYDYALGVKSVTFSKDSRYLAIGSYDDKIRLINCLTWKIITEFEHRSNLATYQDLLIYKEEEFKDNASILSMNMVNTTTRYQLVDVPFKLQTQKVLPDKPNPPVGVCDIVFSNDSNFLASRTTTMPNAVWIWQIESLELKYILVQMTPIKKMLWCPSNLYLIICTDGASVCDIPFEGKQFNVINLEWSSNSKFLTLLDKTDAVVGYPPAEVTGINLEQQQTQ